MIPAAYLRVYVPETKARAWPTHVTGPTRRVIRAGDTFVWVEPGREDAFVAEWNGRRYVCPRHPRLRMLEGALAFSNANPGSMLLSRPTVEHIAAELESLRSSGPGVRSHILTSPWHVPLRWFIPYGADDREMYEAPDGHSLRYRTTVGAALPRVKRAARVVDDAGFDEAIVEQIGDLHRWMRDFDRAALLELDYARVAGLFSGADLVLDDSAELVNASLDALDELDFERAGRSYGRVAERWTTAQALTYVN
jgi:hypothetical protein